MLYNLMRDMWVLSLSGSFTHLRPSSGRGIRIKEARINEVWLYILYVFIYVSVWGNGYLGPSPAGISGPYILQCRPRPRLRSVSGASINYHNARNASISSPVPLLLSFSFTVSGLRPVMSLIQLRDGREKKKRKFVDISQNTISGPGGF